MKESDLLNTTIELARLCGWLVFHPRAAQYQSGRWATHYQGDDGYPDLCLVKNGRVVYMELKSEKGKCTESQLRWLTELDQCTTEAYIKRPSEWDQIERILRG